MTAMLKSQRGLSDLSLLRGVSIEATPFCFRRSRRTGNRSADRRRRKTDGDKDPYRPLEGRLAERRLVRVVAWRLPGPQRYGSRAAEHRGVGPYETRPLPDRVAGVRAAFATALAADRRDRSVWRHTLNSRERRTHERNENNQTGILDERLRLGAGFAAADRPRILRALSALGPHLFGWGHDQVDLEVSLKRH